MLTIAITGQIASGKSTLAKQCESLGAARFDADKAVHKLLANGGKAVDAVAAFFPETKTDGAIDRTKLSNAVFGENAAEDALEKLEAILHPLVFLEEMTARRHARLRGAPYFVSEVQLLFESGYPLNYDLILLSHVSPALQRSRVLARPGMSEEKLEAILSRQMPVKEAMQHADIAINTGMGKAQSLRALKMILV